MDRYRPILNGTTGLLRAGLGDILKHPLLRSISRAGSRKVSTLQSPQVLLRFYSLHRFVACTKRKGRWEARRGATHGRGEGGKKGGASVNESSSRGGTRATISSSSRPSDSSQSSGAGDAVQKKKDLAFQEASRRSIACKQTSISVCIYQSIPPAIFGFQIFFRISRSGEMIGYFLHPARIFT